MAVDRGGLNYGIVVRDEFSATIASFREQILGARADFASLKKTFAEQAATSQQAQASTKQLTKEMETQGAAAKKLQREITAVRVERETQSLADQQAIGRTKTLTQQIGLQAKVEQAAAQAARERTKLLAQQAKIEAADAKARAARRATESTLITQRKAEQKAITASAAATRAEAAAKASNLQVTGDQLQAQRQYTDQSGKLNNALKTVKAQQEAVNTTGKAASGVFQNLLFTFRRLVGVFAAFLIARQLVSVFTQAISAAIRFNAALETAQLGIASVIAATGDIKGAMGGAATSAQQFAIAQREAGKQVQKLRADALATNATFEQLLETFQTAIGPGLSAGIDLDEIRKLTVRISQAATAIGLPQNQLAEEIRSILSGTIQLRTTRLAAVLGITNQDIKNAKELGTLAQFLTDKFQAFGEAGEQSLTTFNVILTNLQDALTQTFAAGGAGLFDSLKGLLDDVQASVATVNKELNQVEINPKAVAVVEALLSGLQAAAEEGRTLLQNISFESALAIATAVGDAFAGAAFLLRNAIEILVSGLVQAFKIISAVLDVARAIGKAFSFLTGGTSFFANLIKGAGSLLVTFVTLRLTLVAVSKLVSFIFVTSLGKAVVSALSLLKTIRSMGSAFAAFSAIIAANPVGIALTLLTVLVTILITKFDLLSKFFGDSAQKAEDTGAATESLSKHFAELSGQISGATDVGGKFGEVLRELQDDLRETLAASQQDISQIGLSGGVAQQARIAGDALLEIQKKVFDLTNEQASASATLLGIQRQRVQFEDEIASNSTFIAARINDASDAAANQLLITQRQAEVEQELASAQLDLDAERERGAGEAFKAALNRVVGLEREQTALKGAAAEAVKLSDAVGTFIDGLVKQGQLTQDEADQIKTIADTRIDLAGKEVAINSQIADILAKRAAIEKTVLAAAVERVRVVAREESFRLQTENNALEAQAAALRNVSASRQSIFDTDSQQLQLAAAANELAILQQQTREQQFQDTLDRSKLEAVVASAAGTNAELDAQRQLTDLITNQTLKQDIANQKIDEANRLFEIQRLIIEKPVTAGIAAFSEDFRTRAFNNFQNTIDLMATAVNGLSKLLSDSLVDAFDPTTKVDLKERFARFFQDIARLLAEQQINKLIANLLPTTADLGIGLATSATTAATTLTAGGVTAGQALIASATTAAAILSGEQAASTGANIAVAAFGAEKGGSVPGRALASLAHFAKRVRGYVAGGSIFGATASPPAGVSPKDTVPMWGQEGEFMEPLSAVRKYGVGFLEAIRRGALSLTDVSSLMGKMPTMRTHVGGPGFATGGLVERAAERRGSLVPAGGGGGPTVTAVAPTERNLERLQAGGRAALQRALGAERSATSATGRRGRPR